MTEKEQGYENNLKLHQTELRARLNINLNTDMPEQIKIMKTILWVNFLVIALALQFLKSNPLEDIIEISMFSCSLLGSVFAIITI